MSLREKRGAKPHAKLVQRIVGAALSALGLGLTVAGAVLVRSGSPLWYILFVGIPIIIVGVFLLVFSFQREVVRYVMSEHLGDQDMSEGCSLPYGASASHNIDCPHCGASIPPDSVYCNKCGKKLQ